MNFRKQIEKIATRHDVTRVFDDFLTMSVCAFSFGRMEDQYNEVARRYDAEEIKLFGAALGALMEDYEAISQDGAWGDILGDYFQEISSKSQASRSGQFFTPVAVCDMMAQMTEMEGSGERVNDPSCGSSRNLIAHSRLKVENRIECWYVGQDLDRRCILMSVLNFIMYGMRGVLIHMNTLSLEIFGGYRVHWIETGLGIVPLNEEQCKRYVYSGNAKPVEVQKVEIVTKSDSQQLSMF